MSIDKLNKVQSASVAYTPAKYTKSDKEETESKRDILTLTEEAQQFLENRKPDRKEEQKSTGSLQLDFIRKQLDQTDKEKNKMADMSKCFKIAARISNGDKVPLKDIKYLRENAPELYKNALMFKKHNPEPKKYKSCLNEEDEKYMAQKSASLAEASVGADDAIVLDL